MDLLLNLLKTHPASLDSIVAKTIKLDWLAAAAKEEEEGTTTNE
jgi:hypothetical protein